MGLLIGIVEGIVVGVEDEVLRMRMSVLLKSDAMQCPTFRLIQSRQVPSLMTTFGFIKNLVTPLI